jgi:hypothetical protein
MIDDENLISAVWGEDDRWMAPGSHGQPADDARRTAAAAYRQAAAMLKGCEPVLRAEPDRDEKLDAIEAQAIEAWVNAIIARNRFRSIRECVGES